MLEANIDRLCPEAKKKKLKDVCRTRWVERVSGMDTFQELYFPLVLTCEEMRK